MANGIPPDEVLFQIDTPLGFFRSRYVDGLDADRFGEAYCAPRNAIMIWLTCPLERTFNGYRLNPV